jgi:hypothetical protein
MKSSTQARRDRLAAALRENLKRRKATAREAGNPAPKASDAAQHESRPGADKKNHLT